MTQGTGMTAADENLHTDRATDGGNSFDVRFYDRRLDKYVLSIGVLMLPGAAFIGRIADEASRVWLKLAFAFAVLTAVCTILSVRRKRKELAVFRSDGIWMEGKPAYPVGALGKIAVSPKIITLYRTDRKLLRTMVLEETDGSAGDRVQAWAERLKIPCERKKF
ncbi:hypothetical protein [Paenibacillus sp. MBLB4367]|uniref:hypothetical protein n=1 Tax=Paenibacillus sp. MBLB4367 TaxID=3384767 RepID=UPI0039080340